MLVTDQELGILVSKINGESNQTIAKRLGIKLSDVNNVFPKIADKIKTTQDVIELNKRIDEQRKKARSFDEVNDLEYEVAKEFLKSQLGSKTAKFTNNVLMYLKKDTQDDYECITETLSQLQNARECIPKDSKIVLKGIQLGIATKKGEMSDESTKKLENFGFQYMNEYVGTGDDEDSSMATIFAQTPEHFDTYFDEFLKTYNDFCRKRSDEMRKKVEKED